MDAWELPGYEVQEMLGFGGTGEVWRARDTGTGEVVALKRLRPGAGSSAAAALEREAAVLRSLDTPYVVRLRRVVGDVLVLDHAAGGSLSALLSRRGALDPGEVVTVGAPVAQALAEAHAAGLVHGDVSPSNVLFTAEGMPLLSDLGLARALAPTLEDVGVLRGTAEYLDPAVAAGAAPGPASDVWALGAVCHHLLAGTPPHCAPSVDRVLAAGARGERAPLGLLAPQAPRGLVAVVEAALDPEPERRPTAAAFAVALQRAHRAAPVRLTGGAPVAAPVPDVRETHVVPRPPRPPSPVPARRRRVRLQLALPVVAVAALLAVGLRWALADGPAPLSAVPALPTTTDRSAPAGPGAGGPQAVAPRAVGPQAAGPSAAAPQAVVPSPVPLGPPPAVPPPAGHAPGAAGPVAGAPPAAAPDWSAVLAQLDGLREAAFARGEPGLLERVYAPGSAAARADTAELRALTAAGRTASGVRHRVHTAQQRTFLGDRAQVHVVDELAAQRVRDRSGATVAQLPGRGASAYDVQLVRTPGGWRIAALTPA